MKAPTSETKSAIRRFRNNGIRKGRHGLDDTGDGFLLSSIAGHFIPIESCNLASMPRYAAHLAITYMLAGATERSDSDPNDATSMPIGIGPHWIIM